MKGTCLVRKKKRERETETETEREREAETETEREREEGDEVLDGTLNDFFNDEGFVHFQKKKSTVHF